MYSQSRISNGCADQPGSGGTHLSSQPQWLHCQHFPTVRLLVAMILKLWKWFKLEYNTYIHLLISSGEKKDGSNVLSSVCLLIDLASNEWWRF